VNDEEWKDDSLRFGNKEEKADQTFEQSKKYDESAEGYKGQCPFEQLLDHGGGRACAYNFEQTKPKKYYKDTETGKGDAHASKKSDNS